MKLIYLTNRDIINNSCRKKLHSITGKNHAYLQIYPFLYRQIVHVPFLSLVHALYHVLCQAFYLVSV
jgi:hypothetical protein